MSAGIAGVLAAAAVGVWALGAAALTVAAWLWAREGRRRLGLIAFGGALVAQASWLAAAAAGGLGEVLDPRAEGLPGGWAGWAVGMGGVAALGSGLRPRPREGRHPASDRAAELAVGLFGLGVLLRQVALVA